MDGYGDGSLVVAGAIATPTISIVAIVKNMFPRLPSWALVVAAFGTGIGLGVLAGLREWESHSIGAAATWVLEGVGGSLLAISAHHLDRHATERRREAWSMEGHADDADAAIEPERRTRTRAGTGTKTSAGKRRTVQTAQTKPRAARRRQP